MQFPPEKLLGCTKTTINRFHVVFLFSPFSTFHILEHSPGLAASLKHIWADVEIWMLYADDLGQTAQTRWLPEACLRMLLLHLATERNIMKTRNLKNVMVNSPRAEQTQRMTQKYYF